MWEMNIKKHDINSESWICLFFYFESLSTLWSCHTNINKVVHMAEFSFTLNLQKYLSGMLHQDTEGTGRDVICEMTASIMLTLPPLWTQSVSVRNSDQMAQTRPEIFSLSWVKVRNNCTCHSFEIKTIHNLHFASQVAVHFPVIYNTWCVFDWLIITSAFIRKSNLQGTNRSVKVILLKCI